MAPDASSAVIVMMKMPLAKKIPSKATAAKINPVMIRLAVSLTDQALYSLALASFQNDDASPDML